LRFLIDECLSTSLLQRAYDAGHGAQHVTHLGKPGASDQELARYAAAQDLIIVTNNARDFRKLMEAAHVHPGLVIIVPNVPSKDQRELFEKALTSIKEQALTDLINQVVEVDFDGVTIYELPHPL
jgi:predicted nuclease of predicted toxin-antitoxin system